MAIRLKAYCLSNDESMKHEPVMKVIAKKPKFVSTNASQQRYSMGTLDHAIAETAIYPPA